MFARSAGASENREAESEWGKGRREAVTLSLLRDWRCRATVEKRERERDAYRSTLIDARERRWGSWVIAV